MSDGIKLRSARMSDADLLLSWKNDLETREASHGSDEISRDDHIKWLSKTLENPSRKLLIAEESGVPVGTVRADFADGVWELSWTTSPSSRGRKVAKRMVKQMAEKISEPIRAEIKPTNLASINVAEYAGMVFKKEIDGVAHYSRF